MESDSASVASTIIRDPFFSTIMTLYDVDKSTNEGGYNSSSNGIINFRKDEFLNQDEETKSTLISDDSSTISDDGSDSDSLGVVFDLSSVTEDLDDKQASIIKHRRKVSFHPTDLVSDVWEIPSINRDEKYELYYSKTELWKFKEDSRQYRSFRKESSNASQKVSQEASSFEILTNGLAGLFRGLTFASQEEPPLSKQSFNNGLAPSPRLPRSKSLDVPSPDPYRNTACQSVQTVDLSRMQKTVPIPHSSREPFALNDEGSSPRDVLRPIPRVRNIAVPTPNPYRDSSGQRALAAQQTSMQMGEPWYDFEVPLDTNTLYDTLYQF